MCLLTVKLRKGRVLMSKYRLSFGEIILLKSNLAEVIVDDGVEMDLEMVKEYHEFLLDKLKHPFSLLINKVNKYTYTFEAQLKLATLTEISSMAVLAYDRITESSTKSLVSIPRATPWNLKIFRERTSALEWLEGV